MRLMSRTDTCRTCRDLLAELVFLLLSCVYEKLRHRFTALMIRNNYALRVDVIVNVEVHCLLMKCSVLSRLAYHGTRCIFTRPLR